MFDFQETADVMKSFGYDNTGNVLWGIAMYNAWQFSSGRMKTFDVATTNCLSEVEDPLCLSTTSFSANMNYHLLVTPFITAVEAGYFSDYRHQIKLLKPINAETNKTNSRKYCVTYAECMKLAPTETQNWLEFFKYLRSASDIEEPFSGERTIFHNKVLSRMWKAHSASTLLGVELTKREVNFLPGPEEQFSIAWATVEKFISATLIASNLNETSFYIVRIYH